MIQFWVQQSLKGETCIVLIFYTAKSAYIVNTHSSQMRVRSACHLLWTLENAGNRFIFPEGRLGLSLDCFMYYVYHTSMAETFYISAVPRSVSATWCNLPWTHLRFCCGASELVMSCPFCFPGCGEAQPRCGHSNGKLIHTDLYPKWYALHLEGYFWKEHVYIMNILLLYMLAL